MEVPSFEEFVDFESFGICIQEDFATSVVSQQPQHVDDQSSSASSSPSSESDIMMCKQEDIVIPVAPVTSPIIQQPQLVQTIDQVKQQQQLFVFLKPAKSREDQYEGGNFPTTMLCTPYKYDLKIVGELQNYEPNTISLELVDADSACRPEGSPSETRPGVVVEAVESYTPKEKVVRFALNWCSFHFRKRAFRLKVTFKKALLYMSTPFHTYARRRDTPYSMTTATSGVSNTCKRQHRHAPLVSQVQQHLLAAQHQQQLFALSQKQQQRFVQPSWITSSSRVASSSAAQVMPATAPIVAPNYVQRVVTPQQVHMHSHVLNYSVAPVSTPQIPPMSPYVQQVNTPMVAAAAATPSSPAVAAVAAPVQQQQEHINNLLVSLERTTMAIQLLSSLSPMEREAVNYYMTSNLGGQQ